MFDYERDEDKRLMLEKMKEYGWKAETNEDSSYEDVENDFKEMIAEMEAIDRDMGLDDEL